MLMPMLSSPILPPVDWYMIANMMIIPIPATKAPTQNRSKANKQPSKIDTVIFDNVFSS